MTGNVHTLNLPEAFANDQYSLVMTAIDNQAFFVTENAIGRTAGSASVSMYDVNGVNQQSEFSWIAIGVKA
jgi:hypothetical protein